MKNTFIIIRAIFAVFLFSVLKINAQTPTAAFTSTAVCLGNATTFIDGSVSTLGDPIVSWNWSLGGTPATSTLQNPVVIYPTAGSHTVMLIVTTQQGYKDTIVQQVIVYNNPVANFSDTASGCAPVCNVFTDLSNAVNGTVVSWAWIFPGGTPSASNQQNPGNICYTTPGTYGASLIVTNSYGCKDTLAINPMIIAYPSPTANFTYTISGNTLTFNNQSSGAVSYTWNFGDGNASSTANPVHQYSLCCSFNVCLNVANQYGCWDTTCQAITLLGVEDNYLSSAINIFPSVSSSGIFTVSVSNPQIDVQQLKVYDVAGKKIFEGSTQQLNHSTTQQIDLSSEKNGIYFVKMNTESGNVTKKIVIAK